MGDDLHRPGRSGSRVPFGVLPTSRREIDRELAGIQQAAIGVAEGVGARECSGLCRGAVEDDVLAAGPGQCELRRGV